MPWILLLSLSLVGAFQNTSSKGGEARGEVLAQLKSRTFYSGDYAFVDDTLRQEICNIIFTDLVGDFMTAEGIAISDEEVTPLLTIIARNSGQTEVSEFQVQVARAAVLQWKVNKALYERYGGRVIARQGSPMEPFGAYEAYLREQLAKGTFRLVDAQVETVFWSRFTNPQAITVAPEDVDFSKPWWQSN